MPTFSFIYSQIQPVLNSFKKGLFTFSQKNLDRYRKISKLVKDAFDFVYFGIKIIINSILCFFEFNKY